MKRVCGSVAGSGPAAGLRVPALVDSRPADQVERVRPRQRREEQQQHEAADAAADWQAHAHPSAACATAILDVAAFAIALPTSSSRSFLSQTTASRVRSAIMQAMDLGLSGKIAVVTGSSRGLGFASANALAAEGCHVTLCARSRDGLDAAVHAIAETAAPPARLHAVEADVSTGRACAP